MTFQSFSVNTWPTPRSVPSVKTAAVDEVTTTRSTEGVAFTDASTFSVPCTAGLISSSSSCSRFIYEEKSRSVRGQRARGNVMRTICRGRRLHACMLANAPKTCIAAARMCLPTPRCHRTGWCTWCRQPTCQHQHTFLTLAHAHRSTHTYLSWWALQCIGRGCVDDVLASLHGLQEAAGYCQVCCKQVEPLLGMRQRQQVRD